MDAPILGHTLLIKQTLTIQDKPKKQRPYPVSDVKKKVINELVYQILNLGIISESNSSYSFPIVLKKKLDKTWRFCVDFRYVNSLTENDSFSM